MCTDAFGNNLVRGFNSGKGEKIIKNNEEFINISSFLKCLHNYANGK